jgi:hypothetical protein
MASTSEEMETTEYAEYTEMENGLLMTTSLSASFRVFRVSRGSLPDSGCWFNRETARKGAKFERHPDEASISRAHRVFEASVYSSYHGSSLFSEEPSRLSPA